MAPITDFAVKPITDRPDLGDAYGVWRKSFLAAVVRCYDGKIVCRDCESTKCDHAKAVRHYKAANNLP